MIKSITAKLSLLFLLIAITTCYYERETDQLKICYIKSNNIWTMNIDGSEQKQITFKGLDYSPSWSPDGNKIFFYSDRINPSQIFIINKDGSGLKQITNTTGVDINEFPTWSSDGNIIFTGRRSGSYYIFISNTEGTILNSFSMSNSVTSLSIAPDGKNIYFQLSSVIYKMPISTGNPKNILLIPNELSVSPDGNSIVHADSGSITIHNMLSSSDTPISSSGKNPCWTPDGKTIVYASTSGDICSIDIYGTNNKPLTTGGSCSFPCVQGKPK